jgi:hypothetical protein
MSVLTRATWRNTPQDSIPPKMSFSVMPEELQTLKWATSNLSAGLTRTGTFTALQLVTGRDTSQNMFETSLDNVLNSSHIYNPQASIPFIEDKHVQDKEECHLLGCYAMWLL